VSNQQLAMNKEDVCFNTAETIVQSIQQRPVMQIIVMRVSTLQRLVRGMTD
tara:strand:- start:337 stop:489 length:153 start_codon:yes stop_codon:yes gene_type:complete